MTSLIIILGVFSAIAIAGSFVTMLSKTRDTLQQRRIENTRSQASTSGHS
jgi:hypothetical protein